MFPETMDHRTVRIHVLQPDQGSRCLLPSCCGTRLPHVFGICFQRFLHRFIKISDPGIAERLDILVPRKGSAAAMIIYGVFSKRQIHRMLPRIVIQHRRILVAVKSRLRTDLGKPYDIRHALRRHRCVYFLNACSSPCKRQRQFKRICVQCLTDRDPEIHILFMEVFHHFHGFVIVRALSEDQRRTFSAGAICSRIAGFCAFSAGAVRSRITGFCALHIYPKYAEERFILPVDPFRIVKTVQFHIGHSQALRKIVGRRPAFRIQDQIETCLRHPEKLFKTFAPGKLPYHADTGQLQIIV